MGEDETDADQDQEAGVSGDENRENGQIFPDSTCERSSNEDVDETSIWDREKLHLYKND